MLNKDNKDKKKDENSVINTAKSSGLNIKGILNYVKNSFYETISILKGERKINQEQSPVSIAIIIACFAVIALMIFLSIKSF